MGLQIKKLRDMRSNLWAGLGMTGCFVAATVMLISGLAGGDQRVPPSAVAHAAPLATLAANR